jgi:hypothetical protein
MGGFHGGGGWRGGFGPALAGGLIAGAVIGGVASSCARGPGTATMLGMRHGTYGVPGYGGYGPAYYGYGPGW